MAKPRHTLTLSLTGDAEWLRTELETVDARKAFSALLSDVERYPTADEHTLYVGQPLQP